MNSKIEFSTKMFNLKEKGQKLLELMRRNQKLIRERGINSKEDLEYILEQMNSHRTELD